MKIDYKDHYDEDYWTGKKRYADNQTYHGPSLAWDGFQFVVDAIVRLIPPSTARTMLDVGCGGGDLVRRFRKAGYDARGIDISRYAIENAGEDVRPFLDECDITNDWSGEYPVDFLIATDLLEHIYEPDISSVLTKMRCTTQRYAFFCVATSHGGPQFIAKKGEPIPADMEGVAVAGHVNVRPYTYWYEQFVAHNFVARWDLMYLFQMRREANKPWQGTPGWNMPNTWILEVR